MGLKFRKDMNWWQYLKSFWWLWPTRHEIHDGKSYYVKERGNNSSFIVKIIGGEEDCPVCHGQGATTDHHNPCTECGGSGKVGGER